MLEYSEIKPGKVIVFSGEPYTVVSSHVFRKQQRKPVNQTKLKNLITGKVVENSFGSSEKAEEAELTKKHIKYLFNKHNRQQNTDEYWFVTTADQSDRFSLTATEIGSALPFIKPNDEMDLNLYEDKIIGIALPIKLTFQVTEAPPNIKGNTATGGNKLVTIETGAAVNVPMFVETDDMIVVNTETGEYVERAKKELRN